MRLFILSLLALLAKIVTAQTNTGQHAANYEAANWKIWLIDNPQQISLAAPPVQSKSELQNIKQVMNKNTEKDLAEIKYWNAGAPAYRWNQIVPGLIAQKQDVQLRMPASWMNLAIYDATILAWKEKLKYKRKRPAEADPSIKTIIEAPATYSYPCEHAVTAAAAANVLAYFFPAKKDSIMQMAHAASESRIKAGVSSPADVEAGWKLGEAVAIQIVEKAKHDGSEKPWDGKMNTDPKKWTGAYPLGITLAKFTPVVLKSPDQFRPPAPPDFANDMKEMKNFKQSFKTQALAFYWANTADAWTDFANQKMFENRMSDDAPAVAQIYAVLTVAYHDAAIAIMDAKYAYWGIRPDQYDTTYKPLIATPPFPGYPSGHAAGSATSCAVLEYFFPADTKQLRKMAQDCADSRFYAGIHFRTDNEAALTMGAAMGKYIVETWMKGER